MKGEKRRRRNTAAGRVENTSMYVLQYRVGQDIERPSDEKTLADLAGSPKVMEIHNLLVDLILKWNEENKLHLDI